QCRKRLSSTLCHRVKENDGQAVGRREEECQSTRDEDAGKKGRKYKTRGNQQRCSKAPRIEREGKARLAISFVESSSRVYSERRAIQIVVKPFETKPASLSTKQAPGF